MTQDTLFDTPLTTPDHPETQLRHDAPDTSRAAAELVQPKSGTQRMRVLAAIAAASTMSPGLIGLTDAEIESRLELSGNSVRPRRGELVDAGWVEDSGVRREHGHSGLGIVWRLTEAGRRTL